MISSFVKLSISILLPALLVGWTGFALLRRNTVWGRRLIVFSLLSLTILSMPVLPKRALLLLESYAGSALPLDSLQPPRPNDPTAPQAIVVLGAGVAIATEYGTHSLGAVSLQRLRYGATLARRTRLPLLVSGGNPDNYLPHPEAWYMQKVLTEEFGLPAKWVEDRSSNTHENAVNSAALLKQEGVRRIYLVTTATHMMRARRSFEGAGLEVIPAPTSLTCCNLGWSWQGFLPAPSSLVVWHEVLHEVLGVIAYRLRGH